MQRLAGTPDPVIVYVEGDATIEPIFLADKETKLRRYGLLPILLQLGFAAVNASIGMILLAARWRA